MNSSFSRFSMISMNFIADLSGYWFLFNSRSLQATEKKQTNEGFSPNDDHLGLKPIFDINLSNGINAVAN